MAFGIEATADSGAALVGNALSFPLTVTSANKIAASATYGTTLTGVTGVTRNGQAFTEIVSKVDGTSNFEHASLWYLDNPDVGTFDVVIQWGATPNQWWGGAVSFVDAASGVADSSSNDGDTAVHPSTTTAATAANDIVVSALASDLGPDGTTTNNFTGLYDQEDLGSDSDFAAQYQTAAGANTVSSWTSSGPAGTGWACVAAAFRSAVALPSGKAGVYQGIAQPILLGFAQ